MIHEKILKLKYYETTTDKKKWNAHTINNKQLFYYEKNEKLFVVIWKSRPRNNQKPYW